jgi:hypothetical protein
VTTESEIERLRSRAAHYRREATRARRRARLIFCRALASHLEREAIELERVIGSGLTRQQASQRSNAASPESMAGELENTQGPKRNDCSSSAAS